MGEAAQKHRARSFDEFGEMMGKMFGALGQGQFEPYKPEPTDRRSH